MNNTEKSAQCIIHAICLPPHLSTWPFSSDKIPKSNQYTCNKSLISNAMTNQAQGGDAMQTQHCQYMALRCVQVQSEIKVIIGLRTCDITNYTTEWS